MGEGGERRDADGVLRLCGSGDSGREEGLEAVVEVGKEENFPLGEGIKDGGLVYTVERAGFGLADSRL